VKAKTVLICLTLATILITAVPALDWGGTIDNATSNTYAGSGQWLQEDKLSLWFASPLGSSLQFTAQASYTFSYTEAALIEHILDIDRFDLSGAFLLGQHKSSQLRFLVGRFPLFDMTRLILDDRVDGFTVEWITAAANTTVSLGYTGLQWERVSTIAISSADNTDSDDLAPPRLVGSLQAQFPQLFLRQDLYASILFQQDLRSEGATFAIDGVGGRLSSQYFGLAVDGAIIPSLYHNTFAYLGTGSAPSELTGSWEYASILSFSAGLTLRYFAEQFLASRAELGLLFTSGDGDFNALPNAYYEGNTAERAGVFMPISRQQLAVVFSPRLGNLIVLDAGYSIKPRKDLQAAIKALLYFRPTTGPIMDARATDFDSKYLGAEVDGLVNFRPFSDLGASLSMGVFLPMGGAFTDQEAVLKGQLEISFSF